MKHLTRALLLVAAALGGLPALAPAETLYMIDTGDRVADQQSILDASFYASTPGGIWRLIDGSTFSQNNGPNQSVRSLPDGVSLVSISSSDSSEMYARGSDGVLYEINNYDRTADPSSLLDVALYPSAPGGIWRLIDGSTFSMNNGFDQSVRSLPDGVSLVSISSSDISEMYARGSDGILYQIDSYTHAADPLPYLDVSLYGSPGGEWQLLDGSTVAGSPYYLRNPLRGLSGGVSLVSISSASSSTIYAFAVPEPAPWALGLAGAGAFAWRVWRRA